MTWFRTNFNESCAIEVKATAGNSIPESALLDHQRLALSDAGSSTGLTHKLSDEAMRRQPFDAFYLISAKAFVVACFTSAGVCYVIPIEQWKGARVGMRAPFTIKL